MARTHGIDRILAERRLVREALETAQAAGMQLADGAVLVKEALEAEQFAKLAKSSEPTPCQQDQNPANVAAVANVVAATKPPATSKSLRKASARKR